MMKTYIKIQPEVIVGLGLKTELKEYKSIDLEDWLGDDLMECYPLYLVTEELKKDLVNNKFKGFCFSDIQIRKNEYFEENYQLKKDLPQFHILKVAGKENIDDLYIDKDANLFIGKEFLNYLETNFNLNYMDVNPIRNEFDDLLDKMIAESKLKNE